MATHIASTTATYNTFNDDTDYYLAATNHIDVVGNAVSLSANSGVIFYTAGYISSRSIFVTVSFIGGNGNSVYNIPNGVITGGLPIYFDQQSDSNIYNSCLLDSENSNVISASQSDGISISNDGSIYSPTSGISIQTSGIDTNTVHNSGKIISSQTGVLMDHSTEFTNTGFVYGETNGVSVTASDGSARPVLRNDGIIPPRLPTDSASNH